MKHEGEPMRFRSGECEGRLWGGQISEKPFSQALCKVAVSKGFLSQRTLAFALGKKQNSVISEWFRGVSLPGPEQFGNILIKLEPRGRMLDCLVDTYGEAIRRKREKKVKDKTEAHKNAVLNGIVQEKPKADTSKGTYRSKDVAAMFNVSKQLISYHCGKLGWGPILTKDQIAILGDRMTNVGNHVIK